ncbi:uncharacterized protein PgNI_00817 [Pyricularia grisea]|uniref:Uncharacterized protein n=1 Tax=Pyricularia grisea TaxID=148305 RepID=A0A6P8BII6_PYRGI|nr:uncharacterized protein PgNI_00817 [Pyricularia grisea]TLD16525.1 hypothetical protein PgNI_00817 [Pyricularia grisea]
MSQGEEQVSEASLTELGKNADVLYYALQIWLADDEVVHSMHRHTRATEQRLRSCRVLMEQLGSTKYNFPGANSYASKQDDTQLSTQETATQAVTGREAARRFLARCAELKHPKNYLRFFAYTEFFTSTLACMALAVISHPYWRLFVVAGLTKMSTKLKILGRGDLGNYAEDVAEDFQDRLKSARTEPDIKITDSAVLRYCSTHVLVSRWLHDSFSTVPEELGARAPPTMGNDKLEGPKKDTGKIALIQRATSEWKIDEVSVTVGCLQYSLTISLLCVIMVALGLTSAFTLGESIEGVDPFNIATFT